MLQHFIKGTAILDRMIPGIRRDIVRDTLSPDYGGVCLPEKGFLYFPYCQNCYFHKMLLSPFS